MIREPLVTIGMPVYESGPILRRALDCLTQQTYRNLKIIISDDASPHGETESVARAYAARDPRIRCVRQERNLGHRGNFAFVAREARGAYFLWAADDDRWEPDFVLTTVALLAAHPDASLAMPSFRYRYDDGALIREIVFAGPRDIGAWDRGAVLREALDSRSDFDQFFYGLFRTEFLHCLLRRPFPRVVAYDRVFMGEVALGARIVTSPRILWEKTVHRTSLTERYGGQDVGRSLRDPHRRTRYVAAVVSRLMSSPGAPFSRRLAYFPRYGVAFPWQNRGYLLHECAPRLYRILARSRSPRPG